MGLPDWDGVLVLCAIATVAIGSIATSAGVMNVLGNFMVSPGVLEGLIDPEGGANDVPMESAASYASLSRASARDGPVRVHSLKYLPATGANGLTTCPVVSEDLVGRVGLEPTTNALKGRCSTS